MVNLDDFKKSLGNLANEMSEEQIIELREQQDKMAEVFFNSWLSETRQNDV